MRGLKVNNNGYSELYNKLELRGGVMTCEMSVLRDIHGAGKLGINVVEKISEELGQRGISHFPRYLPLNQNDKVRLFKRRSPLGELIAAVIAIDERSDDKLRDIAKVLPQK
jgi:hypothetical protein